VHAGDTRTRRPAGGRPPTGLDRFKGMAFGAGWIGSDEDGTLEAVWRLVVRGQALEGRFALRGGVFVALAEEA
jgi:hypothetical protein